MNVKVKIRKNGDWKKCHEDGDHLQWSKIEGRWIEIITPEVRRNPPPCEGRIFQIVETDARLLAELLSAPSWRAEPIYVCECLIEVGD